MYATFAERKGTMGFLNGLASKPLGLVASGEFLDTGTWTVLTEYKISRSSRRCARLDRAFKPGEVYWTVVSEHDDELQRIDIAAEAWTVPPEDCLAYWKNRMPLGQHRKLQLAPDAVLVDLLLQLADDPAQQAIRFLLALLLIRRKIARQVEDEKPGVMQLEVPPDDQKVSVTVCEITPELAQRLQVELVDLLYCEAE